MIIGVDAGALSITDDRLKVGVWRVTLELLKELSKIDKKNEYRLYSFLPIDRGVMAAFGPRMENIVVTPKLAWSMIQLPIELNRHPVDVFLGLSQMLPYSPSSYNIGFIYDLGFLHNPNDYPESYKKLKNQTLQLVQRSSHIITISYTSKKDIISHYKLLADRISVAYPGVETVFRNSGEVHKEKYPYILMVGALKRGKNIPRALRIFKKYLKNNKKDSFLVLVGGDKWPDPEIPKLIHDLDLQQNVVFTGYVSDDELARYYRGAHALLITSHWEGFCITGAEAIASGCPVVYIDHPTLREVIGFSGQMFKTDTDAIHELSNIKKIPHINKYSWRSFAKSIYEKL